MGTPVLVSNRLKNGRDVTEADPRMQFYKDFKPPGRQERQENQNLMNVK
jgi:hypothetical protein